MTSPFGRLLLVVNVAAGTRKTSAVLGRLEEALRAREITYDVHRTEGPGDATRITRRALEDGRRLVVAVGGDGTMHEVVNGMFAEDGTAVGDPVLGVVGAGSGCDFIRTFDLPADPVTAAERLDGSNVRPLDIARISFVDSNGRPAARYYANIAEAGLGAVTARRAVGMPAAMGPSRYFFAFWAVLPGYRPAAMRIEVDGEPAYDGRAVNVVIANCRFFGGGMHISPASDPGDGVMELLVFKGRKTDSFTMMPQVYRGRHMPHRNIVELKGRRFRLESEHPYALEADGEVLGATPATIEVLPRAVRLKV